MENSAAKNLQFPLDVVAIRKILPHRYPFLMLDRVTEFVDLERIVGEKCVSANEPFFQGHFPEQPIMPGVLMLEALAQLGAIFAKLCTGGAKEGTLIVFSGADDVRFRRLVVPGDKLRLQCEDHVNRSGHWRLKGTVWVGEDRACQAVLKATEMR